MTLVNLRVLLREFAVRNMPIGRITAEAVDANGPHFDIEGEEVTFSERGEALIVDGTPNRALAFEPTDGTYAIRWRFYDADENVLLTRHVAIPDLPEVDFGALELINPNTLQPSPDVRAAWEATVAIANGAASSAAGSASAAGASAANAATSEQNAGLSAETASEAASTATGAAATAAGASGTATQAAADAESARALAAGRATSASNSATAAAGSATDAAGSATSAAGSATQASSSASAAEIAKTGSEAARDLALAGQYAGSPIAAGTDLNTISTRGVFRQGTGANATLALNYPVAGTGGILEVFSPNASVDYLIQRYTPFGAGNASARGFYLRVKDNGVWAAWRFEATQRVNRPAGQPGVEVLPWDDTTSAELKLMPVNLPLGSTNLDLVLLDGVYYQDNSANVTTANGYPTTGGAGMLRVSRRNSDSFVVQEYVALSGAATQSAQTFIRRRVNGGWAAWQQIQTGYTDTTVGRRLFVNDEVNGRPQMVYGDTGWRDVGGLLINGWTANASQILFRRYGATVMLKLIGINRASATSDDFLASIPGFRNPGNQGWWTYARSDSTIGYIREQGGTISIVGRNLGTGTQTYATFQWLTDDAWPASLPGTPYGAISVT